MSKLLLKWPILWHLCWFVDALHYSGNRHLWEFLLQRVRLQIDAVADQLKGGGSDKENEDPTKMKFAKEAHMEDKTGPTTEASSYKEPALKKLRLSPNDKVVHSRVKEEGSCEKEVFLEKQSAYQNN